MHLKLAFSKVYTFVDSWTASNWPCEGLMKGKQGLMKGKQGLMKGKQGFEHETSECGTFIASIREVTDLGQNQRAEDRAGSLKGRVLAKKRAISRIADDSEPKSRTIEDLFRESKY